MPTRLNLPDDFYLLPGGMRYWEFVEDHYYWKVWVKDGVILSLYPVRTPEGELPPRRRLEAADDYEKTFIAAREKEWGVSLTELLRTLETPDEWADDFIVGAV